MKASLGTRSTLTVVCWLGITCILPTAVTMAGISGKTCVSCHTMHNSQDGAVVEAGGPFGTLLNKSSCLGCHTGAAAQKLDGTTGAPYVALTADPSALTAATMLPGGYFYGSDDTFQHNPVGITAGVDGTMTPANEPPGWDAATAPAGLKDTTTWAAQQLTCAGESGCHGDHTQTDEAKAISGGHHNATTIGYRLLTGINGSESGSYTTTGNIYAGADAVDANSTGTVSALCGQCHADFHGNLDTDGDVQNAGGAWIRHPTDIAISSAVGTGDDYDDATTGYGGTGNAYNAEVAVGFTQAAVANDGGEYTWPAQAGAMVICLSCHRAHGSQYADLLRWDYTKMTVGNSTGGEGATGCFRCHNNKDGI